MICKARTRQEFEKLYESTLIRGLIKLRWLGGFMSYERFNKDYERLNDRLEQIEEDMFSNGVSIDSIHTPRISELRRKLIGIINRREAIKTGYFE